MIEIRHILPADTLIAIYLTTKPPYYYPVTCIHQGLVKRKGVEDEDWGPTEIVGFVVDGPLIVPADEYEGDDHIESFYEYIVGSHYTDESFKAYGRGLTEAGKFTYEPAPVIEVPDITRRKKR